MYSKQIWTEIIRSKTVTVRKYGVTPLFSPYIENRVEVLMAKCWSWGFYIPKVHP